MSKKSKKWLVIAIISLVLFAAEVVAAFLFVLPSMQKNEFFDYVKKGDVNLAGDAQKTIDKLSDSNKKDAVDMVEDLIVKETNNYISGKKSYSELKRLLITVENIKDCWGMTAGCFKEANKLELGKIYDELAQMTNGSSEFEDKKLEFKNVYMITDENNQETDQATVDYLGYFEENVQIDYMNGIKEYLESKLKISYDEYVAGNLDADKLSNEAELVIELVYNGYYSEGFAYTVQEELKINKEIRDYRDSITSKIDSKDYIGALKAYDEVSSKYGSNVVYLDYRTEIEELRQKAYDQGQEYYKAQFEDLKTAKDKDGAQKLYDEIKDYYGSVFNIDEILGSMKPEWADAYIDFLKNYEANCKAGMDLDTEFDMVMKFTSADYAKDAPIEYLLMDVTGDKIPELILMGDIMSHFITYENGKAVYLATTGILADTATPNTYVTAYQYNDNSTWATEIYAEFTFSGKAVSILTSAYGYIDNTGKEEYKVNGAASDNDGFVKTGNEIIAKAAHDFGVTGKIDSDYETTISNYQE